MNENIENVIETEAIPDAEAIRVVVENNGHGVAKKVAIGAAVITVLGGIAYGIIKALKNKPAADQEEVAIDITDCDCEDDDAEDDDEDDSEEETEE